jgi:hypothetical protein
MLLHFLTTGQRHAQRVLHPAAFFSPLLILHPEMIHVFLPIQTFPFLKEITSEHLRSRGHSLKSVTIKRNTESGNTRRLHPGPPELGRPGVSS